MHNLMSLGTASLDTMGGLITNTAAVDLPEGASPRTWDTDYITGSVFTRAGLASVYTFATTFQITSVFIYNGEAQFTYIPTTTNPTINETFVLSGFTGFAFPLNGTTIVIDNVNTIAKTFSANVSASGIVNLPLSSQNAFVISTTGLFVGPKVPTIASQVSPGVAWANPTNILGNVAYSTVTTTNAQTVTSTIIPTLAASVTVGNPTLNPYWDHPTNLLTTSTFANAALPNAGQQSAFAILYDFVFSPAIPSGAVIQGVQVNYKAAANAGSGVISVQFANNTAGFGTAKTQVLTSTPTAYQFGGASDLWGAASVLTPTYFNAGISSGFLVWANNIGSTAANIEANSFTLTVYYTVPSTATSSQVLSATSFGYALSNLTGVHGFGVTFQAFSTGGNTSLTVQLLKAGLPVGNPKVVQLNSVPQIYSIGASTDLWGTQWLSTDVNNTGFGVSFQAAGNGTTSLNDVDTLVYVSSALSNFNWIKTFKQQNNQIFTLALDAQGTIWEENVNSIPGFLSIVYTGIIPGSYAKSTTADDREFICFSDLTKGTDRPKIYDGTGFFPLSQVGPGVSPTFTSSTGTSSSNTITITAVTALGGNQYQFTYTGSPVGSNQSYKLSAFTGAQAPLNGKQIIAGNPTATQFTTFISSTSVPTGTGLSGLGTLSFNFPIKSISQAQGQTWTSTSGVNYTAGQNYFDGQEIVWCAGVNNFSNPGTTWVFFYLDQNAGFTENAALVKALNSGLWPVYVYLSGSGLPSGFAGTWLVTGHGTAIPPHETAQVPYFTVQAPTSGSGRWGGPGGSGPQGPGNSGFWQMTAATLTFPQAVPGLVTGGTVQIEQVSGAGSVTSWNNTWTILQTPSAGTFNITSTFYPAPGTPFSNDSGAPSNTNGGLVQYSWSFSGGNTAAPQVGQLVTVTGCTNLGFLNVTGYVFAVSGAFFYIDGFSQTQYNTAAVSEGSSAQAITFGTTLIIDPGTLTLGTGTNPIYGDFNGTGTDANVTVVGTTVTPIGSGTRQGMVFFITESGFWTPASPPVTFTTSAQANYIFATKIPTGPSNVIGRGIAFTEAGQNGVAGANFYVIPNQVTGVAVSGQAPPVYSSTIIWDNTTTSTQFTFTDAVLLNSQEVDVPGADLFNLIELGSPAWDVLYASRMFYGLQLNKVQNFNNLSFDGGPVSNGSTTITTPAGWTLLTNSVGGSVIASPVNGNAWYILNSTGGTLVQAGAICQSAFQDAFNVPILNNSTTYSVRVAASCPSALPFNAILNIQLCLYNSTTGTISGSYGLVQIPLSSMLTTVQVFDNPLLTSSFNSLNIGQVPATLVLAAYVTNLVAGADCLIDRIEVYPTMQPVLGAQVYGSYINSFESIDASGSGGILDTTAINQQFVMGGFVMHDSLYLLKTDSLCVTEDSPGSEPGGWSIREVSNKVGSIGIHSYDVGEEWAITACRSGIFGFNGGQPIKLMQEIWNLWETINWSAGNTIVLRNDTVNRRILCAVPLPTPNQWLPFDPPNPAPTSPNVILMCNYQGLNTFDELMNSPQLHTTMFGTLAAVDMKRKWSIWRIKTPYMDFILRQDQETKQLMVCNGIMSSKIYEFLDNQLSDDGVPIFGLYTTYGFVNAAKAATLPIFGFHQKRYTTLQFTTEGAGNLTITALPNTLSAKYPYTIPGKITLADPCYDDYFRPLNVRGNRVFLEFSTNAVGSWFNLHKVLLSGKADSWAPINPTGGGNLGVSSTSQ